MTIKAFNKLKIYNALVTMIKKAILITKGEQREQIKVNLYCLENNILMFAIPNGANKSRRAAMLFKAEGLKAGIPDCFIPMPKGIYAGLFIEMKDKPKVLQSGKLSTSHTKVSPEQEQWLNELMNQGYYACVCYGSDEAIKVIDMYIKFKG